MAENVGSESSELESITSSQKSYLQNCHFAGHDTDSDKTEVLENQFSPAVVETPVLSFTSPTSLDSINGEVFRTPPENASLSSAADSDPGVRVSEIKLRGGSNLKSPSSTPVLKSIRAKHPASDSASSNVIGSTSGSDSGGYIPFKEIIEALLRNSGEKLNERDENVSCVDILKRCGFKFP